MITNDADGQYTSISPQLWNITYKYSRAINLNQVNISGHDEKKNTQTKRYWTRLKPGYTITTATAWTLAPRHVLLQAWTLAPRDVLFRAWTPAPRYVLFGARAPAPGIMLFWAFITPFLPLSIRSNRKLADSKVIQDYQTFASMNK